MYAKKCPTLKVKAHMNDSVLTVTVTSCLDDQVWTSLDLTMTWMRFKVENDVELNNDWAL